MIALAMLIQVSIETFVKGQEGLNILLMLNVRLHLDLDGQNAIET